MADVKWIKLASDIFDNRKIRQIEALPDGDAIIVIWIKLLCLAGNINDCGLIYFTKEIPYTEEMMATQFGRPLQTVKMALQVFKSFKMIEIERDILHIANWERYQNIDGMDRIREQNRIRKQKERERKRIAQNEYEKGLECVTCHVTVTESHATEEDKEKERDKEGDKEKEESKREEAAASSRPRPVKHKHGEYENVLLTDVEFEKLKAEFPNDWQQRIDNLSRYMKSKGTVYKDHLATIRNWARRDADRSGGGTRAPRQGSAEDLQRSYDLLADFAREGENGEN